MSGVRTEELDYASSTSGGKYNGLRRVVKTCELRSFQFRAPWSA